jgi:hypothetical protein
MIDWQASAAKSTFRIFGSILGVLFLMAIAANIREQRSIGALIMTAALFFGFMIWISAFRLSLREGVLKYRSLFGGLRSIRLSDVERAEYKFAPEAAFGPFVQLVLTPHPNAGPPVVINMKVFSRADLDNLLDILGPKLITKSGVQPLRRKK